MREIKFRAWDEYNKKYFYSDEYNNLAEFFEAYYSYDEYDVWLTLEQSTGLKDANGVEIFEGDICTYKIYMTARQKFPAEILTWIWSEYHCGFAMITDNKDLKNSRYTPPVMIPDEHEIEIIGNIHTKEQK